MCIATVSLWHGLDRLLHGMSLYTGSKTLTLHIVGKGQLEYLRKLSIELGLRNQVIFHEYATGEELDGYFNRCHIGVGSLGIHRKGLLETSELKAREYCSRGFPYINAAIDRDYPADFPYRLMIAPDESPINIDDIISFAEAVLADPDHPNKMRHYAEEHLDWSVKTKMLKGFLEELVD
nr:glycosyltransferase [Methanocalculus chunghsingensis]